MAKKIITLDPGHGKNGNKSPNNPNYIEGTQMWHLANKLKAELERYGFEVVTTRPKITDDPSISARGEVAGKNGSCMFLSLHSNAPAANSDGTYSKTCTGTVTYYSMTRPENKTLADSLGNKVSEIMGHYYRGSKTKEYPNKPGVDYYGVIRSAAQNGCKCAFIIEHGFHTSVADSNFLLDDSNLQKIAEAEAKIIAEYFSMTEVAPETPEEAKVMYRVQIGAFSKKENAEAMLERAKAAGFTEAFIKAETINTVEKTEDTLSVGDKVKMATEATIYGKTTKFQSWVYNSTLYVRDIDGSRVVVSTLKTGDITGAVDKKYLTKI